MNGTRPAGRRTAAPWEASGRRRAPQLALAARWLLDAVLQYQTFMLSQGFPRMLMATAREPGSRGRPDDLGVAMAHMLVLTL